jgi:hypothetical protein
MQKRLSPAAHATNHVPGMHKKVVHMSQDSLYLNYGDYQKNH